MEQEVLEAGRPNSIHVPVRILVHQNAAVVID
jgi:hypothetical protein